ncbi:MAG TPA: formate dehydrogenase accessory sulfurtransferase FdhD, partial [Caulobacteraceae bacterium]|nr:formate dehydrogenase accessory sulfurtransferase FdhD [Caulobacteraceae bacterium]
GDQLSDEALDLVWARLARLRHPGGLATIWTNREGAVTLPPPTATLDRMGRAPSLTVTALKVGPRASAPSRRAIPEETAVALVYDGGTEAVMMATPADLEDFALGFSLNEGVIGAAAEIRSIEIADQTDGIELRLWLAADRAHALAGRRRTRAGPTGCGLCGVDSLAEALRPLPAIESTLTIPAADLIAAMRALSDLQALNRETRAVHAAALFVPGEGIIAAREDVGRHNALDKLAGALAREGRSAAKASSGAILMTSRISVELVQKAAIMGAPILAAVSAPTALALRTADGAGITLAGIVRDDGFEVFTWPERIGVERG